MMWKNYEAWLTCSITKLTRSTTCSVTVAVRPYSQLLRYFEQDRGVLVLETFCDSGFVIVSICMKVDQLEQLRRDYCNGKLNKDLENCLVTDEVLQKVSAKGIKIQTDIDQDEFELAEQELA